MDLLIGVLLFLTLALSLVMSALASELMYQRRYRILREAARQVRPLRKLPAIRAQCTANAALARADTFNGRAGDAFERIRLDTHV